MILKVSQVNANGSLTVIEMWQIKNGIANPVIFSNGKTLYSQVPPYSGSPNRYLVPSDGYTFLTGYSIAVNQIQNLQAILINNF